MFRHKYCRATFSHVSGLWATVHDLIACRAKDWPAIRATLDNPGAWSTCRIGWLFLALGPGRKEPAFNLDLPRFGLINRDC